MTEEERIAASEEIRKKMNEAAQEMFGNDMYPFFSDRPSFYYDRQEWLKEAHKNEIIGCQPPVHSIWRNLEDILEWSRVEEQNDN